MIIFGGVVSISKEIPVVLPALSQAITLYNHWFVKTKEDQLREDQLFVIHERLSSLTDKLIPVLYVSQLFIGVAVHDRNAVIIGIMLSLIIVFLL
ncbi:TPA: hypothetical protein DIC40_04400 [Patescibacteria group bacterium]|nr:hypothetical protein [Candidatus Gracilibacteria bacterium]